MKEMQFDQMMTLARNNGDRPMVLTIVDEEGHHSNVCSNPNEEMLEAIAEEVDRAAEDSAVDESDELDADGNPVPPAAELDADGNPVTPPVA